MTLMCPCHGGAWELPVQCLTCPGCAGSAPRLTRRAASHSKSAREIPHETRARWKAICRLPEIQFIQAPESRVPGAQPQILERPKHQALGGLRDADILAREALPATATRWQQHPAPPELLCRWGP